MRCVNTMGCSQIVCIMAGGGFTPAGWHGTEN